MIRKPIIAFQNPTTIQGKVSENNASKTISTTLKPPGDSASAASASTPATVATNRTANSARRPVTETPVSASRMAC